MRRLSPFLALALVACGNELTKQPGGGGDTDTGGDAQLVLSETELDFGAIGYGELYQANLNLSNPGATDLVISTLSIEAPFRVSPPNLQLRAGGSSTVTVFVQATTYEQFDTFLNFQTADADIGTVTLPVTAVTITDADNDGHDVPEAGGDDCDDDDPAIHPGVAETWYDGIDEDCDGASDFDQDKDGYESEVFNTDVATGGGDCQDARADFYPGAPDAPYDNLDTNCDDWSDWDADHDGYGAAAYDRGSDCDDGDASVNLRGVERFDGKDNDCDGEVDIDAAAENSTYVYAADGTYDRAGYSLAIGDLDGDGAADLVVGAPGNGATSAGGTGRGGVAVWRGGAPLPGTGGAIDRADNWMTGTSTDGVGSQVAVVGDTNGDGFPELAIASQTYSSSTGRVWLVEGRDAVYGDITSAVATYTGTSSSQLGRGIASDVDLDGDGLAEVILAYANGSYNGVGIDYGGGTGTIALGSMDAQLTTDGTEGAFYRNAPVGGDLDGDGRDDLILSDGRADYGSTDSGAVWAVFGSATRLSGAADVESRGTTILSGSASGYMGWSSQLVQDWDSDGDDELWVYDKGTALYVIEGGPTRRSSFTASSAAAVTYTWDASTSDAEMIRQIGDWDGDGANDVLVFLEDSGSRTGLSWLFGTTLRSGTYVAEDALLGTLVGSTDHGNGNVGYGLAALPGDLDEDGDLDTLVGDPEFNNSAGEVYVLLNGS